MRAPVSDPAELEVEGLTVSFGGLVAVSDVSLHARAGTVTGLIGPNGAGKTTTFNACTGFVTPAAGVVRLDGRSLGQHTPSWRARAGLGRTFQRMVLADTMTVAQNVALGLECRLASHGCRGQLWASRRERRYCTEAAEEAMDRCGIAGLAGSSAGDLSTGQRRLVELARALAGRFRFLLLDEPSSGLDEAETEAFGRILLDVTRRDGTGILLVEHDMALVRQVCRYAYVLDFGKLVFQGVTAEVMASDVVGAAYLGSQAGVA